MDEDKRSLTSLFHRLCELSFLKEAELREDDYTKIRYTRCRRRKLQIRLYEKLFDELQAPWVRKTRDNNTEKLANKTSFDAFEKIAVIVFRLRTSRQFDKADWLEYNFLKWRSLPGSLKTVVDLSEPVQAVTDPDAVLRFIVALTDTGPQQSSPILGYQDEFYFTKIPKPKELKTVLPEGPLLSTDSYVLKNESLLGDQYVLYSSDLFERPPTMEDAVNPCKGFTMLPDIMVPGQGRSRFFAVQETGEVLHEKKTRLTVFGALSHGYTDNMQVKLGLPELPPSSEKTLSVSSLPSLESPEDEGFHEITDPSSVISQKSTLIDCGATDIWTEALKLPTQKFYTWEMEGRRDGVRECPYITEAGPTVFDELYNLVSRQVSYLVKTPTVYTMVTLKTLVEDSLHVLIGVPTTTFLADRETLDFHVNPDIRLSGCSPESLHTTLSKLAAIGSDYIKLVEFISQKELSGGLVLHAFIGGLRNYLQFCRAIVLSIDSSLVQSPFQLTFTFLSIGKQLRFLADMCMCSSNPKGSPSSSDAAFPLGVKLLSYLYKLCLEHSSTGHYPVLLSLLKHSCAPYILFIKQWVFQGICRDAYEEFIIEVDDQFLAYRDKHFWSHGFVISEKDKLDCVPMFLSELANDIFVCGKSINLMKLCCPDHFLCDSGVPPPKMEVTYSMEKLKAIDRNCLDYVHEIENIAKDIKDKRENERLKREEAKEKALIEERVQAEKALAELTGLIQQVKEAIDAKKKADLKMLKEQMEEAIKKRQLDKERETEVDNKYMVDALNRAAAEEHLREQARQELIDYYQKLTEEMDLREERAQWKIKRHKLNNARIAFFAQEQANLEKLKAEASDVRGKEGDRRESENADSSQSSEHPPSISVSKYPDSSNSSQALDHQSRSVSSPSLVSLIASGVKTDALVKLDKSLNASNISDSGFVPGTTTATGIPGKETKDGGGDVSEEHTLHSVSSFAHDEYDGDETDVSVASNMSAPTGRKKWSDSKDTKSDELKSEPSSTTSRRTWDPASAAVNLAESLVPQAHPSDSSIQFSLYDNEKLNTPKDDHIGGNISDSSALHQGEISNPSDSSIQDILYPVSEHRDKGTAFPQESAKSKAKVVGESSSKAEETVDDSEHPEEQPKEDAVIQDFLHSLSKGVDEIKSPLLGHPSDSNLRAYASESHSTEGLRAIKTRSPYGHPNQSSAQSLLYPTQDLPRDLQIQTKSPFGHPNQSSAQSLLYPSQNLPRDLPGQTKSSFGHPNDSTAQNMLYGIEDSLTAQDTLRKQSSAITDEKQTPSERRSPYSHPSDLQISATASNQNILAYKSRSHWGHPSDSKVQKLLGDISTLSESKETGETTPHSISLVQDRILSENTRGTPPADSAKDIIYPVAVGVSTGGTPKNTRGHEPAVKITKLMYPDEQEQDMAPEPAKPLQFEDVWIASEVEPLQVNFDALDEQPTTDLLKSALTAVPIDRDDDDDDIEAAQLMTLPVLLRRSVTAPLMAQISLVNSAVVEYFMENLDLSKHFEVFRKFLFMEDGEFALSLSDQLFEKLTDGVSPLELCSPNVMNGIVNRALQLSVYADKTGFEQELSFALKSLPDRFNLNDIGTLDFLELRYRVQWPLNIIITENSILKYNKVFSFMLRLKRVAWVLRDVWFHLKHIGCSRSAAGSPQLRQLQLFRHEMLHFLQNIEGYLSNQILNVTWVEFQEELTTNVRDLDDLHHRHTEYLNKAIFRSLLSKKASPVMKIISDMFSLVLKFRTQLLSCPWQQDGDRGHVTHPRFDVMCSTHIAFKEYSGFLFTVLSKLVRRGYQSHLQDFLLRLNFNDFYKT